MRSLLVSVALLTAAPAVAQDGLQGRVEARLAELGPGASFGLVVTDETGKELVAVNPDGRFLPASNTKMFTAAAAFAALPGLDRPDAVGGAAVRIDGGNVILVGNGDARMSSKPDCTADCLATLADAVAAKVLTVRDVIGDDTLFPDERWSPGMAWNNIPTASGTGVSALSLDDNVLQLTVTPGQPGAPPKTDMLGYYDIDNRAQTVLGAETRLEYRREPNRKVLLLTGTIGVEAKARTFLLGIDDPAYYAAWRFKTLLQDRGVEVTGKVAAHHRPLMPSDDPDTRQGTRPARSKAPEPLARLVPAPLAEDLTRLNKVSQNLHAELVLRRIGLKNGSGSMADGLAEVRGMLQGAGVPRLAYDLSDGSGLSTYNRVTPRGMITFLRWIPRQPWAQAYRDTLPIGGVDGTLAGRFKGSVLAGRLFAKTGTLIGNNALSGWMIGKSGKLLTFSAFANNVPSSVRAAPAIDAALVLVAESN